MDTLPLASETVMAKEHAARVDRETHLAHRGVELAADAFASALADFFAGRINEVVLHAAAQATAPKGEGVS